MNRTSSNTGMYPFFFNHGYHINPIEDITADNTEGPAISPAAIDQNWLDKYQEATAFAQASLALAQEVQERHAYRRHQPTEAFRVYDCVYLRLKNLRAK